MNRPPHGVPLQHEDAWSSRRGRVILDNDGVTDASQDIAHQYIIFGKLVIAMVRNADRATRHKGLNLS